MTVCHQCGKALGETNRTAETCSYCFAKNVSLCPECAWWEIDPIPAPAGAPFLTEAAESRRDQLVQPCGEDQERTKKRERKLKKRREQTLKDMAKVCKLIQAQVKDKAFKAGALAACEVYDAVYHDDSADGPDAQAEQRMLHTLIVLHLSAAEKCKGYVSDSRYDEAAYDPRNRPEPPDPSTLLHRHDAPLFAQRHLQTCFSTAGDPPFIPLGRRRHAFAAIGTKVIERLLREKVNISKAHRTLHGLRGEMGFNTDDLRTVLEIATKIYHACTAAAAPDASPGNFDPRRAHGWLLDTHKAQIIQGGTRAFTESAKNRIGTLFASCQIAETAPVHRWPDVAIQGLALEGLTDLHKQFLQSLPGFDHTGADHDSHASPCEEEVRRRVQYRIKELLSVDPAPDGMEEIFRRFVADGKIDGDGPEKLLDAIVDTIKGRTCWFESSSNETVLKLYLDSLRAGSDSFALANETLLRKWEVQWAEVLDQCPKSNPGSTAGSFVGMRFHPLDLAGAKDSRQDSKDWYLDWRHDKDEVIYDCHDFPLEDLPNFTSLTFWPKAPEPNMTYGAHMTVWRPNLFDRAVFTVGDWGHPRRSIMLLLQDLISNGKRKDGSDYSSMSQRKKLMTFQRILLFVNERLLHPIAAELDTLNGLFDDAIGTDERFKGDKPGMSTDYIEAIEAHLLGPVVLRRDAMLFLICNDRNHMNDPAPADDKFKELYDDLVRLAKSPTCDVRSYRWESGDRTVLRGIEEGTLYKALGYSAYVAVLGRPPAPGGTP